MLTSKLPKRGSLSNMIVTMKYTKVSHILAPVFSELFNISTMEVIFVRRLKNLLFIPILKSEIKDQTTNYRPVSTIPLLTKKLRNYHTRELFAS